MPSCNAFYAGRDLDTVVINNYGTMNWTNPQYSTRYYSGPTINNYGTINFVTGNQNGDGEGTFTNYGSITANLPTSAT